ncbi:MAG: biopolymer transporter ExbD [Deltaproteobacteria bacterium]|nr:MAG: biopolymer transporter ExbD [Deltaproteobacteria bacterium]
MTFRIKRRDVVAMDITPLVDVVFLLLIFFMLSTTFIVSPGIKVELPKADGSTVRQDSGDIRVKIASTGEIYLDDQEVDSKLLGVALRERAGVNPQTVVVIEADASTQHKYVVEVMDTARASGLTKMAIATKQKER